MNHAHFQFLVTRVMPYGKYKGWLIAGLPGRYLNWSACKRFPPGEIGHLLVNNETIRLMTEIVRVIEICGGRPDAFQPANAAEDLVA